MAKKKGKKKDSASDAANDGDKDDGAEQENTPATSTLSSSPPAEEKGPSQLSSSPAAEATPAVSEDALKASDDRSEAAPAMEAAEGVAAEEKETVVEEVQVSAQASEPVNSEPLEAISQEVASAPEILQPGVVPQSEAPITEEIVHVEEAAVDVVVPPSKPEKTAEVAPEPVVVEEKKLESITIAPEASVVESKAAELPVPESDEHQPSVADTEPLPLTATAFVTPATEQSHALAAPEKVSPSHEAPVPSKNSFKKKSSVGIPKELHPEERVGLVPKHVQELTALGLEVVVESDAGKSSGFLNEAYQEAGAEVTDDAARVWKSDVVVKMQPPSMRVLSKQHECNMVKKGGILICNLRPKQNDDVTHRLSLREGSVLAVDLLGHENLESDITKSSEKFSDTAMSLLRDMLDDGKIVIGTQALVKKALVLHDGTHTWFPPQEPAEKKVEPKSDIKDDLKPAPPVSQTQRAAPAAVSMATEKTPLIAASEPLKKSSIFCCCCGD